MVLSLRVIQCSCFEKPKTEQNIYFNVYVKHDRFSVTMVSNLSQAKQEEHPTKVFELEIRLRK